MSSGNREALWRSVEEPGLEHLILSWRKTGYEADGMVIGIHESRPYRLHYFIEMDTAGRVLQFSARAWNPEQRELILKSDGEGNWMDSKGVSVSEISGSIDVDITVTPFTNTLPIRRLQLQKGQSAEILVAYIDAPELKLSITRQRYTCLDQMPNGALYRFEGLDTGFQADLTVDDMGLVTDYPNLWMRIF